MSRSQMLNRSTNILTSIDEAISDVARLKREVKKRDLAEAVEKLVQSAAPCVNNRVSSPSLRKVDEETGFVKWTTWSEFLDIDGFILNRTMCDCEMVCCFLCNSRHQTCKECHSRTNLPGLATNLGCRIDRMSIDQAKYQRLLEDDYDAYRANRA